MAIPRLLVVDDDPEMRDMMTRFLHKSGFAALPAATGAEVAEHMASDRIDLILLDVMLGDESGLEICSRLRRDQQVPIIFVSALSADHQRMAGYEVGADDYVTKPFNPQLLVARIRAVLHRLNRTPSLAYRRETARHHFCGWCYDAKHDALTARGGFEVALSRREAGLLKVLLANPHIPLTRDEIAAALDVTGNGPEQEGSGRAIDVLVGRLRAKIEETPRSPRILRTERGVGYVLSCDVHTEAE